MSDIISMNDMLGVASGDKNNMLGKLLYFSLSDLLIDKEKLTELCAGMGIYYVGDRRVSVSDAFKSATGDIKDRIVVKNFGQQQIYRVYCRDNEHTARYLEFNNSCPGANGQRVSWSRTLSKKEAAAITPDRVFAITNQWNIGK